MCRSAAFVLGLGLGSLLYPAICLTGWIIDKRALL